ncbi:MAG: hypothetical protein C4344_07355, partial [Acidimicrobiia bacterium]
GIWDEIERLAPSHAGLSGALLRRPAYRDGIVVPLRGEPPRAVGVLPDEALAVAADEGVERELAPTPGPASGAGADRPGL